MKVAIVHDYLNQLGGAERVVAALHEAYPDAEIRTLFVDSNKLWPSLRDATIRPTLLQRWPFIMRHFKLFFWLYPFVMKNTVVHGNDVVFSSSSAYAVGVHVGKSQSRRRSIHICYCHTPMRFAWDFDSYISNETSSKWLVRLARLMVPLLKRWDIRASRSVDFFIANSTVVQERIRCYYNRDSVVIHPPVQIRSPSNKDETQARDYFLIVSRLVSYKRIDLAVRTCTSLGLKLVVIGRGPDQERLKNLAGPTIQFLGFQPEEVVTSHMASCKALIFPGEEDFGITPLEANSLGRPVVAFRGGGALDTIVDGINGVFFSAPTMESLSDALQRVNEVEWKPDEIRAVAQRFDQSVFEEQITQFVKQAVAQRMPGPRPVSAVADRRVSG